MGKVKLIPVLPKNYRSISLRAIDVANDPHVFMDQTEVFDFTDRGNLTQQGISSCANFEIKDGSVGIVGFHDHPNQMWVNKEYEVFANECQSQGWLIIEGPAS